MAISDPDYTWKILLLGDGFVGKTSLVNRYVRNTFTKEYLHTIGMEPSFRDMKIKGLKIALQIFDIAGQKSFQRLREMFYRGARGGLITFDLTRPETLASVEGWYKEAHKKAKGSQFILVGNKHDLTDQREVSEHDAREVAEKLKMLDYIETSALTGAHVESAFMMLGKYILKKMKR